MRTKNISVHTGAGALRRVEKASLLIWHCASLSAGDQQRA